MNILFAIAEAAPLYKIGGLGDVGGALPKALLSQGFDVRIVMPFHPEIVLDSTNRITVAEFSLKYSDKKLHVTIFSTLLPGSSVPVYLVYEPVYLSIHTDASDNHADKFAVLSLAISTWITTYSPYWQPHIIHCHDWHTALIPVILKHKFNSSSYKTIITIHNLAYQGITLTPIVKYLDLDASKCQILSWDNQDGDINILLEGLLHCDAITTVSPTYAKEILTVEYGEKINSILESRKNKIRGIINGIDVNFYNPQSDSLISARFDSTNWLTEKAKNRQELRIELDLNSDNDQIMIGFVGRVDPYQKGIGLLIQAIKDKLLPPEKIQFVFLGTGDPQLESQLHDVSHGHPNIRIITRFDEPLAHRIFAAAHTCLIPSRFEPCGLVQLIAMRYGCLPIARATGGLKDTIFPNKNGFLFEHYNVESMIAALNEALNTIKNETLYAHLVSEAMSADYSWNTSAREYGILYKELAIGKTTTDFLMIDNQKNIS